MTILVDEQRTARKLYDCDASYHWRNYGPPADVELSAGDLRAVEEANADEWKIRPGQRYRYVAKTDGRRMEVYRARLGMDSLCNAHDLYDDA